MNKREVPVFKFDKRLSTNIFGVSKSPLERRFKKTTQQHRRMKVSIYSVKLIEKQKVKAFYGASEAYFKRALKKALKMRRGGNVNVTFNFFKILETRLDVVLRRCGISRCKGFARQLINHKHFAVNGKSINIPSFGVKVGDEITFKSLENTKLLKLCQDNIVASQINLNVPNPRFSLDTKTLTIKVLRLPETLEEITFPFNLEHDKVLSYLTK